MNAPSGPTSASRPDFGVREFRQLTRLKLVLESFFLHFFTTPLPQSSPAVILTTRRSILISRRAAMSSDDKNKSDQAAKPKRLVLGGDAEQMPNADRVSTVMVNDPIKQKNLIDGAPGGEYGADAEPTNPFIKAGEPTPPPRGNFIDPDEPTPPTSRPAPQAPLQPANRPRQPARQQAAPRQQAPPRQQQRAPHQRDSSKSKSAYDAEHISNTGFIPSETFKVPAVEGKKKKSKRGKKKFSLPNFRWLDDGDMQQRLAYGGGGLLAGALAGGIMGVLNAFLQGWSVAQGATQIIGLAVLVGLAFAIMAAMKPSRVDHLMDRLGLGDDD
jgi:hypothetical protein